MGMRFAAGQYFGSRPSIPRGSGDYSHFSSVLVHPFKARVSPTGEHTRQPRPAPSLASAYHKVISRPCDEGMIAETKGETALVSIYARQLGTGMAKHNLLFTTTCFFPMPAPPYVEAHVGVGYMQSKPENVTPTLTPRTPCSIHDSRGGSPTPQELLSRSVELFK